jgi:hypothetical protein
MRGAIRAANAIDRRTCECGRPKGKDLGCCDRCSYLDNGAQVKHGLVIAALRGTDGLSITELCHVLGIEASKDNGRAAMHRTLSVMIAHGRLRRYWRESEGDPVFVFRMQMARRARLEAVYALDGLDERAWRRRAR